jgi:hypothetical protein
MTMNSLSARRKISLIIVSACFCISMLFWGISYKGKRYVLLFRSSESKDLCLESRYIRTYKGQSSVSAFVDELLLGPETERYRPLFSPGTRASFCFVRDRVLYVNLTGHLLSETGGSCTIKDGMNIFKSNIKKNFKNIKKIEMFADRKSMYECR